MEIQVHPEKNKKVYWSEKSMIQTEISDQYEVALQRQILKVFHASKLCLHDNHFGNEVYTNYQRLALIVLFQRSRKALSDFVAELKESKWAHWLRLKELSGKSTLHRWLQERNVALAHKILRHHSRSQTAITNGC